MATVTLNEERDRILVVFRYDPSAISQVKAIHGRKYHEKPVPHWSVPLEIKNARALRRIFGDRMETTRVFRVWAKKAIVKEKRLRSLVTAHDAELRHTPELIKAVIAGQPIKAPDLPKSHALRRKRRARPYQRADIRAMAMSNLMNCNEVGTGKTLEAIGAVCEAQLDKKPLLIIAPRRTLVNVWRAELERYTDFTVMASESPADRQAFMAQIAAMPARLRRGGWAFCGIAEDLRLERYYNIKDDRPNKEDKLHACRDFKGNWYKYKNEQQKALFKVRWGAVIIDEFHTTGANTRTSLFHVAIKQLILERLLFMSATPMGGKPRRLWPILHLLDPKEFSSEWNWIDEYLEVTEDEFYGKGGKKHTKKIVGGIRDEHRFYHDHRVHMIRRVKTDALPGLPQSVEILVDTPMLPGQRKLYNQFDEEHEVVLEGGRVSASVILAKYTRLREFANWIEKYDCKIEHLIERLSENGVRKTDYEPNARAYVGAGTVDYVNKIVNDLRRAGIDADPLTGKTKDSKPLLDKFAGDQEKPYVLVMTFKTGGSGLNMEQAGSAHALEEMWDPDIMTQFFGRGDRGSRTTPLRCYTYRTPHSIQEYVADVCVGKTLNNNTILKYAKQIERRRRGISR